MPVTDSSFVFRWAIVHDGVMRRSDDEAVDVINKGISRVVAMTDVGAKAVETGVTIVQG